ncbi:DUF1345 domain-containing protein [Azospirillum sp. TSO22-1]|uniref:DUF1345 domain-containing protein n=1 Tax=Azospirillum sp. TSO22-1 TaxID=716789 RepID=UPI000D614C7C|nr:DUF1345 domain-containing protein [Azospirillum sp. TSO22-1]PWC52335.1 hypothetical protein TSO221_14825 [Azospirillum sp. TSO22-1]
MRASFRHLLRRPTLLIALAVVVAIDAALLPFLRPVTAFLLGWCVGVGVYMAMTLRLMAQATVDSIRHRAQLLEQGRGSILAAIVTAVIAAVAAIVLEIAQSRGTPHAASSAALGGVTILLSWAFLHVVFAQHYAHDHWLGEPQLEFPGAQTPDYLEFLYFSFTVGMTAQVSDITTRGAAVRRLVLLHGILSFLFNTAILALGINIAAGLFG